MDVAKSIRKQFDKRELYGFEAVTFYEIDWIKRKVRRKKIYKPIYK